MPRKRTIRPEMQAQDVRIAMAAAATLNALAERYPLSGLAQAATLVTGWVVSVPAAHGLVPTPSSRVQSYTIDMSRGLANTTITEDEAVDA